MVTGEAAGLAEEDREDIKPLVMTYILEMYNNQAYCYLTQNPTGCRMDQPIPRIHHCADNSFDCCTD